MAGDIDVELGRRLRRLRLTHSVTQQALGDELGITFQQIQKYEAGSNRISVATLIFICRFFAVEPASFLDGLVDNREPKAWSTTAGDPYAKALACIGDEKVRTLLERLAIALSETTANTRSESAAANGIADGSARS